MSGPRIVTPQEAQNHLKDMGGFWPGSHRLLHTVATEPDRIRAAVVKALLTEANALRLVDAYRPAALAIYARLDAIENGADWLPAAPLLESPLLLSWAPCGRFPRTLQLPR